MAFIALNLNEFLAELDQFKVKAHGHGLRNMRAMIRFAHQQLIRYTPYDTGRMIASWRLGINSVDSSSANEGRRPRSAAVEEGLSTLSRVDAVKFSDDVYLTNSVEYSQLVDQGGPHNQPRQIVARTMSDLYTRFGRLQ